MTDRKEEVDPTTVEITLEIHDSTMGISDSLGDDGEESIRSES